MAAHDGIVFLQLFVFLGNAMVNLEIYLCLIVFRDQKAALSEGSAAGMFCLFLLFGSRASLSGMGTATNFNSYFVGKDHLRDLGVECRM